MLTRAAFGIVLAVTIAAPAAAQNRNQARQQAASAPSPLVAPPGAELRSVELTRVITRIDPGRKVGSMGTGYGAVCIPSDSFAWNPGMESSAQELDRIFSDGLRAAGFKVASGADNLFEAAATNADYSVGAVISDLSFTGCSSSISFNIRGKITVEWQVFSRLERKVVATIPASVEFTANKGLNVPGVVSAGFEKAVAALAASNDFRTLAIGAPRPAGGAVAMPAAMAPIAIGATAPAQPVAIADTVGSVVAIFAGDGHGSGFLVSGEGHMITNYHVVGEAKFVKVRWADGFETVGEVIRSDRRRDVALVKTDGRARQPLALRATAVAQGEDVYAIGTPLDPELQNTVTRGIASANRTIDGFNFLQSDVNINGGNSGGPLIDKDGRVVAICVSSLVTRAGASGINLFIPIRDALDFLALKVQ